MLNSITSFNRINTVVTLFLSISTPLSYKTRKQVAGQSIYTQSHLCPTRSESRSPVRVHTTTPLSYKTRKQVAGQSTHNHTSVLQDPKAGRQSEYTQPHLCPTRPESRSPVRVHTTTPLSYKIRKQVASQSTHNHTSVLQDPKAGRRSEYTQPHLCPESRSPVRVHTTTPLFYKTRKQVAGQSIYTQSHLCPTRPESRSPVRVYTHNHTSVLQDPKAGRQSEYTKRHTSVLQDPRICIATLLLHDSKVVRITSWNGNSKVYSCLIYVCILYIILTEGWEAN